MRPDSPSHPASGLSSGPSFATALLLLVLPLALACSTARTDLVRTDPAQADPAQADPAQADPAQTDPAPAAVAGLATRDAQPNAVPGPLQAEIETRHGILRFDLFPEAAPETVRNFEALVRDGFYDGLPFYRVVAGHVIQAGDGGETGQATVPGEFGLAHPRGCLGLARDEAPDTGSTEIYVCHADRPHLDGRYAVFGHLVDGYDVLDRIAEAPVIEKMIEGDIAFHEPVEPVEILSVRLVPRR